MQHSILGPPELGRGAIVLPGQPTPSGLSSAPRIRVDASTLSEPRPVVDELHLHWVGRRSVVVELHISPGELKAQARQVTDDPPWKLGPEFTFDLQRLHFLIWNNNVDFRSEPIWWWGRKAIALGATASDVADVTLRDGTPAYCDGGPLQVFDAEWQVVPYCAVESGSLSPLVPATPRAALAPDQLEAVMHNGGATRIIAPAGSGKTRVLTERLRHLLGDWNVSPGTVCTLAYNTRAAGELTERTAGIPAHIRTLNSIALAIVNGTGGFAKSPLERRERSMLDERGVRNILQELVDLPRKANTDPFAAWIEALTTARLGLCSPTAVESTSGDFTGFAEVFDRYRARLEASSSLDFDEQIYRAIEILLQDADARQVAQRKCRTLLVDEFQDLTPAHMLLIRLLATPALDVFGVGDDDQVIYGYSGADPRHLVDFEKWFPGARHHALEVNYRCPPLVVQAASNLLTRNPVRVDKIIRPPESRTADREAFSLERVTADKMARRLVEIIEAWNQDGCEPSSIAVLTRVNVTLLPVQVLLSEAGIPHNNAVGPQLLERTGIRTALAYLRIGVDAGNIDRADILETVRRPSRRIARNVVEMMTKRRTTSLSELRKLARALNGKDVERIEQYVDELESIATAVRTGDTAEALDVIRNEVGLGEAMDVLDGSRSEADRSTHADDLAALVAVAHLHDNPATFEGWLRTTLSKRSQNAIPGVELSTIHRVKGREWDRVVVYDASAGLMPHRLCTDRAEERRVFHVAITRCRDRVAILADGKNPSPFVDELAEPGEPDRRSLPRTQTRTSTTPKTAQRPTGVPADVGLAVTIPGGMDGEIVEVDSEGALIGAGRARTRVKFGTQVRVAGKLVELVKPHDENTQRVIQALKDWRRSIASDLKLPPYTVLHDSQIEGIAVAAPSDLRALSKCNGIGPAKLERWGDEILSTIEAAVATVAQ